MNLQALSRSTLSLSKARRCVRAFAFMTLSAGVLPAALAAPSDASPQPAPTVSGEQLYEQRCSGCHSLDSNRIGPRHAGLSGRRAGSIEDFDYSPALKASKIVWTSVTLKRWLADPEALIPGQRMGYRLGNAEERERIITYLLSN